VPCLLLPYYRKSVYFRLLKKVGIMRIRFITFIILLLISPLMISCKKNHYKINTSSIKVQIEIKRLEKDLFTLNPDEITTTIASLKQSITDFFSYSAM